MHNDLRIFLKNPFGLGLFRVILALAVVIFHSGLIFGIQIIDGVIAVESFYIISGFLMTLILTQKYHSYDVFIINRILRLYPAYLCVLFLSVIISMISYIITSNGMLLQQWIENFYYLDIKTILILLFTNFLIIGQDIILFLGINEEGSLFFTPDFWQVNLPAWKFLLVPQAWTISIELVFYLIAPFLVNWKTRSLAVLFMASFGLRMYFYTYLGLSGDPWNYRFLPFELIFFILGILSFRLYLKFKELNVDFRNLNKFSGLLFISILLFNVIPFDNIIKMIFIYVLILFTLPLLFNQSNQSSFDKKIGDYSYPIYIGHYLVISVLTALSLTGIIWSSLFGVISIISAIAFAAFLLRFIEQPVDKVRYQIGVRVSEFILLHKKNLSKLFYRKMSEKKL